MASTILDPPAAGIVAIIEALGLTASVTGYKWGRLELDSVPAGVVAMPILRRTGVEERESQLGANDWTATYPVLLAVDLDEAVSNQAQVIEMVEAFVAAVDADYSLGGTVEEAKVVECEPYTDQDRAKPLIGYECMVETLKLVAT